MSRLRSHFLTHLDKLFGFSSDEDMPSIAHFRTILAAFVSLGFHVGVWAVLLADLAGSLALSPGALGLALSVMTVSGIVALLTGGRFSDLFGRRPFLLLGTGGTGVFFLLLALIGNSGGYTALLTVLVFGGVCASSWDLAVNSLGGDYEHQQGIRVMTPLHACFSGAAATGALLSGVALWAGANSGLIYAAVGVGLIFLSVFLGRAPLPRLPQHRPEVLEEGRSARGKTYGLSILLVPAVAACALIVFLGFSTDAALEGFLSVYLRDTLSSGALLGGAGVATLHVAAMGGRLAASVVLGKLGERITLAICGLASAFGMTCVALAGSVGLAIAALLLVGVAASPVAPVIFSLTARAIPEASGRAISLVTISGYVAFSASPLLVGTIADLSSLRSSLLLLAAFGIGVAVVARLLPEYE